MPGVAGIVWIWAGVVVCMEKGICKILQDASISIGFLWHTECVNVKNSVRLIDLGADCMESEEFLYKFAV